MAPIPAEVLEDWRASRRRFYLPCREASASGQLERGNARDDLRPADLEDPPMTRKLLAKLANGLLAQ